MVFVRTNDNRLIQVTDLYLEKNFYGKVSICKYIYGEPDVKGLILGSYDSKERALEILDEIEKCIGCGNLVYYLPEK